MQDSPCAPGTLGRSLGGTPDGLETSSPQVPQGQVPETGAAVQVGEVKAWAVYGPGQRQGPSAGRLPSRGVPISLLSWRSSMQNGIALSVGAG